MTEISFCKLCYMFKNLHDMLFATIELVFYIFQHPKSFNITIFCTKKGHLPIAACSRTEITWFWKYSNMFNVQPHCCKICTPELQVYAKYTNSCFIHPTIMLKCCLMTGGQVSGALWPLKTFWEMFWEFLLMKLVQVCRGQTFATLFRLLVFRVTKLRLFKAIYSYGNMEVSCYQTASITLTRRDNTSPTMPWNLNAYHSVYWCIVKMTTVNTHPCQKFLIYHGISTACNNCSFSHPISYMQSLNCRSTRLSTNTSDIFHRLYSKQTSQFTSNPISLLMAKSGVE